MQRFGRVLRRLAVASAAAGGAVLLTFGVFDIRQEYLQRQRLLKIAQSSDIKDYNVRPSTPLPSRAELLDGLQTTPEFDVLVIGGGATGAGVALDAQSRGLKTALVEMDDFSSGTSSRSTKLIHGGVRYLQAAVMKLDFEQYRMVKEALFERANLLEIAPHLSRPLPIMLPVYSWFDLVYYWCGIKAYDFVSGKRILKSSYAIGKKKALELFPMLKKDSLVGALIYYDGQHNDARMNLAIILTAIRLGATCANHVSVTNLVKEADEDGKLVVRGAEVKDEMTGKQWKIRAKSVINATGAFSDSVRQMDNPDAQKLVVPSQGVHIVLPGYYSPKSTGLLDPSTSDGRVIFFLPWENVTVAGTTDSPCEITVSPKPGEQEIEFILREIRHYLDSNITVRRGDVLSSWAGLRPLVRDPTKKDTASLARNHIIQVSDSNLITIAGGKWTTYRQMAEETVNKAIQVCGLQNAGPCCTPGLLLEGAHTYDPLLYIKLVQDYGLEVDVAVHLANSYGDRAYAVARMAKLTGKRWPVVGNRLHEEYPYLEAEIYYAIKEYATTAVDVIARRLRLAFVNTYAAEESLPRIVEIMGAELKWDKNEQKRQLDAAVKFIDDQMGKVAKQKAFEDAPLSLTKEEKDKALKRFNNLDKDKKGYITIKDLRRYFKEKNEKIDDRVLHELLNEVDLNKNGAVDVTEFMQLISGLKGGTVSQSRLVRYLDEGDRQSSKLTVERAGGGV